MTVKSIRFFWLWRVLYALEACVLWWLTGSWHSCVFTSCTDHWLPTHRSSLCISSAHAAMREHSRKVESREDRSEKPSPTTNWSPLFIICVEGICKWGRDWNVGEKIENTGVVIYRWFGDSFTFFSCIFFFFFKKANQCQCQGLTLIRK